MVPTGPDVGERLVITGGIVKFQLLLGRPATVTTTGPVAAPEGTVTVMLVALQFVRVPDVPLKVTVLLPCVAPKFAPVIVTILLKFGGLAVDCNVVKSQAGQI
jgi:hypothetical protein